MFLGSENHNKDAEEEETLKQPALFSIDCGGISDVSGKDWQPFSTHKNKIIADANDTCLSELKNNF
ncbi:hypothetical protein QQP08_002647 [Theobroma cacao]|nr:hypothetical protein QQP08_002647 [Theobroma cacao]